MAPDGGRVRHAGELDAFEQGGVRGVIAVVVDDPLVFAITLFLVDKSHPPRVRQGAILAFFLKVPGIARREHLNDGATLLIPNYGPFPVLEHRHGTSGRRDIAKRVIDRCSCGAVLVECPSLLHAIGPPFTQRDKVNLAIRHRANIGRTLQSVTEQVGGIVRRTPGGRIVPVAHITRHDTVEVVELAVKLRTGPDADRRHQKRLVEQDRAGITQATQGGPHETINERVVMVRWPVGQRLHGTDLILTARHGNARGAAESRCPDEGALDGGQGEPCPARQPACLYPHDELQVVLLAVRHRDVIVALRPDEIDADFVNILCCGAGVPAVDILHVDRQCFLDHLLRIKRDGLIRCAPISIACLDLHVLELRDGRLADAQVGHVRNAIAPDEQHAEILVFRLAFGVCAGTIEGRHTMAAQDNGNGVPR